MQDKRTTFLKQQSTQSKTAAAAAILRTRRDIQSSRGRWRGLVMLDVEIARSCIVVSKNKGDERSTLGNGMKKWARKEARQLGEEKRKEEEKKRIIINGQRKGTSRKENQKERRTMRRESNQIKSTRKDRKNQIYVMPCESQEIVRSPFLYVCATFSDDSS